MEVLNAHISMAIQGRRVGLGLSLSEASRRTHVDESILALAEERPTQVPLYALVRLMEGYGALEEVLFELCIAQPAKRLPIN